MATGSSGSLETLRRLNRLRVIHTLREQGVTSRAEIARRTGLSRSTVSSLVADLQADGLVVERAEHGSARGTQGGRPPILLAFDASAGAAVGIAFGHRGLRVAVSDLSSHDPRPAQRRPRRRPRGPGGPRRGCGAVTEALEEAEVERDQVIGVGVGLPAPIHRATGIVGSSAILPGWVGVSAAEELRNRLGLPVLVDNDANLGALAEAALRRRARRGAT